MASLSLLAKVESPPRLEHKSSLSISFHSSTAEPIKGNQQYVSNYYSSSGGSVIVNRLISSLRKSQKWLGGILVSGDYSLCLTYLAGHVCFSVQNVRLYNGEPSYGTDNRLHYGICLL